MARLTFLLFSIWFLILPFSALSSLYFSVANLAVDKIMAPILVFIWLGLMLSGKYRLDRKKSLLLAYVFLFFIIRNISVLDNFSVFSDQMWRDAIVFGYFALPILFIDNLKRIDVASRLIVINAVVACLSAFLVAFSIIELPYERFSESRIGFEEIQKSIGVITSYGDVTQLAAFFLLLGLYMPEKILPVGKKSKRIIQVMVLLIIVMGLIGNQSRSYLLSLIIAFSASLIFTYRGKKSANTLMIDIILALTVFFLLPFMAFMINEISSSLASIGGKEAMGSAQARLQQYEMAFSLIKENPLFGVGSEFYLRNADFAHGVHNMWLGQLTRGGFVSVLLLVFIFVKVFRECVRLFKNENTQLYAKVLVGYLTAVFVSILFYPADTDIFWALLGVCVAIIYSLESLKTNKSESEPKLNVEEDILNKKHLQKRILRRAR